MILHRMETTNFTAIYVQLQMIGEIFTLHLKPHSPLYQGLGAQFYFISFYFIFTFVSKIGCDVKIPICKEFTPKTDDRIKITNYV